MSNIRWGLLSTANINRRVIPAIRASKRGRLAAVASRSRESAERYASKWEIPIAFGNYQEMLDSDAVDAVYISLPHHLHAEWSIRAMEAGKNVLCEKPFALTLADVDKMIEGKKRTGCVLAEAFMYLHHPQTKLLKEWIHSGRLGEILLVRSVFNFTLQNRDNIRLVPEYGGGCLWDVGVYPLSFAQYIYQGAPTSVYAVQRLSDRGVDEEFTAQMTYSGSRSAQIQSSFRMPYHMMGEIIGTQGRIWLDKPFTGMDENTHMIFTSKDGETTNIPSPQEELYLGEIEDMHAAILDGSPSYLTLEESRKHISTVLALYQSASTGMVVNLE